jgi:ATP-dependent DNA helicase RecG
VKDMQLDFINTLLQKREGLQIEFKESQESLPNSLYETIVSFANTDGGVILLGVDDSGKVLGIDPGRIDKMKKELIATTNSSDKICPPLIVDPAIVPHSDGLIIFLRINQNQCVYKLNNRIFIRVNDADIDITDNQQEVSNLYFKKRNIYFESTILTHLSLSDLDDKLFDKARNIIRSNKSDHPFLLLSDEDMLRSASLIRKDYSNNIEGLTYASALIFGKQTIINGLLPSYKLDALVRVENTDRWDDRLILRSNLIDCYLDLKQFLYKHLPDSFYTENDQRIDLRDKIFREVVANIIVHREYSTPSHTELVISKNSVETRNPSIPLIHGPLDLVRYTPEAKNPTIRRFFMALGWCDEAGTGVRNICKYLPHYVPNARPRFIDGEVFITIIPRSWKTFHIFSELFLNWLDLPKESLPHFQKCLQKITLPSHLLNASWKDLLLFLVPSWDQKGTQHSALDWASNQISNIEQIKKVPSWDQKGTKILRTKTRYLIYILLMALEPISSNMLMDWIGYKNEKYFRDKYLKPLRNLGLVELTNTEIPTDPDNKYFTTEAGKYFLVGP